jgi:3-(3-hydroxy-phenyl)propionate hydroxylase
MRAQESKGAEIGAFDVAIVGYGPVGATLANLLGQSGISTLVLEREEAAYHLPRAVHFDDEVMRVFETIGLAGTIEPTVHISPGMRFVDAASRCLLEWPRPPERTPQGWHASYRFHQPDLETILREGLQRFSSVCVRTQIEALAVDEDAEGVTVRCEDLRSGVLQRARARYVVGCDGARSFIRRKIGETPDDMGFNERWLVVDVLLNRPKPELGDYSIQYCNPARPATYVRGTGNRRRWEIALHDDEDNAEMVRPEKVWELLAPWVSPAEATLERAACYRFQSIVARPWRLGRLLLAGDAAHQTPPFLGQGMCAGIRDVANLAWKLERVLRGTDGEALLDSYETERAPHVRKYIALAVKLGGLINTKAMQAALPNGFRLGDPATMESIKPELGPGLAAGWTGLPRQVVPQPPLSDGRRLDAHVGYAPALLLRNDVALPPDEAARLVQREVAVVRDRARELQDWLADLGVIAAAVRPDRYLLGAARDATELIALARQM